MNVFCIREGKGFKMKIQELAEESDKAAVRRERFVGSAKGTDLLTVHFEM